MDSHLKNIFGILLFTQFVFFGGADLASPGVKFIPSNYLIQIFTKPEHFEVENTAGLRFDGNVTVRFELKKEANFQNDFEITLNANSDTVVKSVKLEGGTNESNLTDIKGVKGVIKNSKLVIQCEKEELQNTFFQLTVEYTNTFGNDMTGFYRSSYKESNGETRWLLTTHFEPIFARKAFPCFDQPDLKAFFEVHIEVPKTIKTVLSNTALNSKDEDKKKEYVTYKFKKTDIPMSTYLVAFTASNFESTPEVLFKSKYLSEKYTENRKLKTFGRKDKITNQEAKLAQEAGLEAINGLTEYLGMGYSFEKVDQVGIPDFSAGAMENFGHISFREKSLFFNEVLSSTSTKQSNVLTITHELVHQWFGNLVTLESWDYIWLNEAFANYIEYVITSKFQKLDTKNWNLMNQMLVNEIHLRAFEVDGLNSSKPLSNKITNESLIYSSFNDIPYCKGLGVLRMWDLGLPNNGFQKSIQYYLQQRKESVANPNHLFDAFFKTVKMDKNTFKTWTEQPGYPVVEVKKINGSYVLNQSRFFWEKLSDQNVWNIPITYSTNSETNFGTVPLEWLYKNPIKITPKTPINWIIVNNLQAGYYRVNYDKENWEALSKALGGKNYSNIPELNRAQIVNDIFSLARSLQKEYIDYYTALNLCEYLRGEDSFVVWKTALNAFDFLQSKVYGDDIVSKFNKYILKLIEPQFKSLNASGLKHVEKLKNVEISRWACALDYKTCVSEAESIFSTSKYSNLPDTQEIVLCTAIRNNPKAWNTVFELYKKEEDSALKVMYLTALGCTREKTVAEEFLKKTLSDKSEIRKQDLIYVLSAVYNGNANNIEVALKFIENNYEKIIKLYGGINPLGKAVVGIAKKLNTEKDVKRLTELAKNIKNFPDGMAVEESIENAIKIAKSNALWVKERMATFKEFFAKDSGSIVSYSFALLLLCLLAVFQS